MQDTNWKYEPHVLSIIGLEGTRSVTVSKTMERGLTRYHAVTTSITDSDLNRLVERVHVAWARVPTFAEQWQEYMSEANYQAGYAYACGYFD